MRIVQLIDTLSVGGAERIAVSYANALATKIEFSSIVVTHKEGILKNEVFVDYDFINKKSAIDLKAILRFRKFVVRHNVNLIHAHGTTFFTAFLLKVTLPKIKIVYHEHYGKRCIENRTQNISLFICSVFFAEIVVVNLDLKTWCEKYLFARKVTFLPNFASLTQNQDYKTVLKGTAGKRIVMVANLHQPKNHLFVVKAFSEMNVAENDWTLHFIGKIFNNSYSDEIFELIKNENLTEHVFLYNVCADVTNILSQSDIGILASTYEGFPVSILEYAQSKLAVVSSNVGYCATIIQHNVNGFLFDPTSANDFKTQLEKCIFDSEKRLKVATALHVYCKEQFSAEMVINQLVNLYSNILK